jgi:transposase
VSTNAIMDTMGAKRRRRRRSWTDAEKEEIVAASLASGTSVSAVARHYDVNANQLFIWRRLHRAGSLVGTKSSRPALVPVKIVDDKVVGKIPTTSDLARIEIALPSGYRLWVDAPVDGETLRHVLDVLERR